MFINCRREYNRKLRSNVSDKDDGDWTYKTIINIEVGGDVV